MYLKLVPLLALIGLGVLAAPGSWRHDLQRGLEEYARTGHESKQLHDLLNDHKYPQLFRKTYSKQQKLDMREPICSICNTLIDVVINVNDWGLGTDTIAGILQYVCSVVMVESPEICHGVIDLNKDTLGYILDNSKDLTGAKVCSMLLQDFGCEDPGRVNWTINIAPPPSEQTQASPIKKAVSKELKILHLTDMHYDPNYEIGSNANCKEPLCCQKGSIVENEEDEAGYWGDYRNCDLPWHTVAEIIDQVVDQHRDIDFIYFTGDIINHKVWDTNVTSNAEAITKVYNKFKQSFGNLPIYPILGNHEPHPVNLFSHHVADDENSLSTEWVFELAANEWSRWLPQETEETILTGGYYTVMDKSGVRIIALNSNVCYTFNFWLLYNDKDPYDQLQWLADTLAEAEKNNEKVYILSHVPTGEPMCLHNWSKEFVKIINRFSHIIAAQFNGHTHDDDTVVFFKTDQTNVSINVGFNGGSLTPYANLNPNYKVFKVDAETFDVLDYESWSYNLTEANSDPQIPPNWKKLYSFVEAYDVPNLSAENMRILVEKIAATPKLSQQYFRYKNRDADTVLAAGCDSECEIANLCFMVTYEHGNNFHCDIFTQVYNSRPKPPAEIN